MQTWKVEVVRICSINTLNSISFYSRNILNESYKHDLFKGKEGDSWNFVIKSVYSKRVR